MHREKLIPWIRENDAIYEDAELFILSDEELFFLKREIEKEKEMQRKNELIISPDDERKGEIYWR